MRLSEWRSGAPSREALSAKVLAVVEPVLTALGAEPDPHCWVAWGDDPSIRYMILVPSAAGLISCHVRLPLPGGEGPRASGKVVRWPRVQIGELAVETVGGRRLVAFQVEQQVLRGADRQADDIAAFGLVLLAAIDGRPIPELRGRRRGRATKGAAGSKAATKRRGAKRATATRRQPAAPRTSAPVETAPEPPVAAAGPKPQE
jgi:hypothetical protein